MNDLEIRLECLKHAVADDSDDTVSLANRFYTFVTGGHPERAEDPLANFLAACAHREEDASVLSVSLYDAFLGWCEVTGCPGWSQKGFSKAMLDAGFSKKATPHGMEWRGLRLAGEVSQ